MSKNRCSKLRKITDKAIDRTISLYDEGKMVEFWEAVEATATLQEVKNNACDIGE